MFSGEESYGKYFDMNYLYEQFVNLKHNRLIPYTRYLDMLTEFDMIDPRVKADPQYGLYLSRLFEYLFSFYRRTKPLEDHTMTLSELEESFKKFRQGSDGLVNDGIWCEVCQKLYSKQTVYDGHLNSKKHKAGQSKQDQQKGIQGSQPALTSKQAIAKREFIIKKLISSRFSDIKEATKANIVRKQTLTDREWIAEQENAENALLLASENPGEQPEEDEDGEEKIYNPLKLPLGWDGKPIPFWLWRLHGLGVEYSCEVCGNHVYMGRKAFDKHFTEWRHVHGLRCLGITNSVLYDQITSIEDAIALHEKTKKDEREKQRVKDAQSEMEDDMGNVMTEKIYNDLKAQGIL